MIKKSFYVMTVILILIIFQSWAMAYLDPGTGMTFVSGIGTMLFGFFALILGGAGLAFKKSRQGIQKVLRKLFFKKTDPK